MIVSYIANSILNIRPLNVLLIKKNQQLHSWSAISRGCLVVDPVMANSWIRRIATVKSSTVCTQDPWQQIGYQQNKITWTGSMFQHILLIRYCACSHIMPVPRNAIVISVQLLPHDNNSTKEPSFLDPWIMDLSVKARRGSGFDDIFCIFANTVEPLFYDHPQNHIGVVVKAGWSFMRGLT